MFLFFFFVATLLQLKTLVLVFYWFYFFKERQALNVKVLIAFCTSVHQTCVQDALIWCLTKLWDSCRKLLASEGGRTFDQLLIEVKYSSQFSTAFTCCKCWILRALNILSFCILPHTDDAGRGCTAHIWYFMSPKTLRSIAELSLKEKKNNKKRPDYLKESVSLWQPIE